MKKRQAKMTTTVMLPVALMERAKIAAIKRHTSFKALVEEGIRLLLAHRKQAKR